jgi:hypothetical protein
MDNVFVVFARCFCRICGTRRESESISIWLVSALMNSVRSRKANTTVALLQQLALLLLPCY